MLRSILYACAAVLVAFGASGAAKAEKRVALVMGVSKYAHAPELANAVNDAQAVGEALGRLGFEVVEGYDLKADEMRKKVREFSSAVNDADVAWLFFAGHGVQVDGKNYIIPADGELNQEADLDFSAMEIDFVMRQMMREARVNIIVLDACRDNPLSRSLARSMGSTRGVKVLSGLAEINKSAGTLISFATEPGNVAMDGQGQHSPFTEALLQHMETPNLEIGSMMTRVRASVWDSTKQKQLPWVSTSLIGEFYLKREATTTAAVMAPSTPARPVAPPPPSIPFDERQVDLALWSSAEKLNSKAGYEEYLRQFPKGVFAKLARERVTALNAPPPLMLERAVAPVPPAPVGPTEQTEDNLKLSQGVRAAIQQRLTLLGHNTKGADGRFGANTRTALKAWQAKNGLPDTGYLDQAQLSTLNAQSETAYREHVAAQAAQAAQQRAARPAVAPASSYEPVQAAPSYQPAPPSYQSVPSYPTYEPPVQAYRPPPAPAPAPAPDVNPGQMLNTINQSLDLFRRLR